MKNEMDKKPIGIKILGWIIIFFAFNEIITYIMSFYFIACRGYLPNFLKHYTDISAYFLNLYLSWDQIFLEWKLMFLRNILGELPFMLSAPFIYFIVILVSAIGLLKFKNWARRLMLLSFYFLLISMIFINIGFISLHIFPKFKRIDILGEFFYLLKASFLLYPIIYLTRPKVREQFK